MTLKSEQGDVLYQIVPALYRNRDTGDLKKYFTASGLLLDQVLATLKQRYADNFPDNPLDDSQGCQDWLLPYFADLLDIRLVSPLLEGRRDEVANAVRWRQGKGTLWVVEEVAQAIGQLEVVLQEGWKRVAATPRLNTPYGPASSYGYAGDAPVTPASMAAKHPGLPAAAIDFSCPSGAVAATSGNPAAKQSTVNGNSHIWRQSSYHGTPCFPGSYEDISKRTVDFRKSDWRVGHYHPDKLLIYTVPPAGFFSNNVKTVNWVEPPSQAMLNLIDVIKQGDKTIYKNKTYGTENYIPVGLRKVIKLGQVADGVGDVDYHTWRFEGLILENTLELDSGRVELIDCAARKVEVHSIDYEQPVITAKSCLLKSLQAARGVSKLEYCTVLEETLSEIVRASDCIFLGSIKKDHTSDTEPEKGCIRFSRIRKDQLDDDLHLHAETKDEVYMYSTEFGTYGCGVLHPAAPDSIKQGSEDGSEMGAYHDDYLSLLADAVVDKLNDYLPVGLEAVVIHDQRLLQMPD